MGRKPKRSRTPKAEHTISFKITGADKNALIDAAKKQGMPLSSFISFICWEYVRQEKGFTPAPAPNPKPTPDQYLREYLLGERVIMPCGRENCDMKIVTFDNAEFCQTCSFRIA
jgi:hypothetical protein